MTDLEITKLCAEAVGVSVHEYQDGSLYHFGGLCEGGIEDYDPLHDDAQAMALVKKFGLVCDPQQDGQDFADDPGWEVWLLDPETMSINPDLNRAICECVAKMQEVKCSE